MDWRTSIEDSAGRMVGSISNGIVDRLSESSATRPDGPIGNLGRSANELRLAEQFDKVKDSQLRAKDAAMYLKKRAAIEDEYSKAMSKLPPPDNILAENRAKFAVHLYESAEDLAVLLKEIDRTKKAVKENASKLERSLVETDSLVEKARTRFGSAADELEKVLMIKSGEMKRMKWMKAPKEDAARQKMGQHSDSYRNRLLGAQAARQEYETMKLPVMIRELEEIKAELDAGVNYHLVRYKCLLQRVTMSDGCAAASTPAPLPIEPVVQQQSGYVNQPIQTEEHPYFGLPLEQILQRENSDVPRVIDFLCTTIESRGLHHTGIYRLSGTTSRINTLKLAVSAGTPTDAQMTDINDITGTVKLYFRALPDSLMTEALQPKFLAHAAIPSDRLRQVRIHEVINALPDANYSTLKYLTRHLHLVAAEEENQMTVHNLAIVWAPTLFRVEVGETAAAGVVLETIIQKYGEIFVHEGEDNSGSRSHGAASDASRSNHSAPSNGSSLALSAASLSLKD